MTGSRYSRSLCSNLTMIPFTKENGHEMGRLWKDTDEESRSGKTGVYTRDNGNMTKLTVRGDSSMKMEMYTKANGRMIKLQAKVSILTQMELTIMVNGSMTNNTVTARKVGQTVRSIRENTLRERSTEEAFLNGPMDRTMMESLRTTTSMVKESITGRTGDDLKETG